MTVANKQSTEPTWKTIALFLPRLVMLVIALLRFRKRTRYTPITEQQLKAKIEHDQAELDKMSGNGDVMRGIARDMASFHDHRGMIQPGRQDDDDADTDQDKSEAKPETK